MSNLKQISKIIRKDTIKIIHNTNTAHLDLVFHVLIF